MVDVRDEQPDYAGAVKHALEDMDIKEKAEAMGISLSQLARTVRSSYYGDEVMRLQRGRHEVQLRVRYPRDERESLAGFDEIRRRIAEITGQPTRWIAPRGSL